MKKYPLEMELFQGVMCPGIPVTKNITFEVEFSDEEVTKIRQLVKDYTGDKEAGLIAILMNDAPDLYERVDEAAFNAIFDFYLLEGIRNDGFILDEDDLRRNYKHDLESGEFNPQEYIEESAWYDEVPTDEDDLFDLWEEWQSEQFSTCDKEWALARYPDLPNHIDLDRDQDYICFIPDEFNS